MRKHGLRNRGLPTAVRNKGLPPTVRNRGSPLTVRGQSLTACGGRTLQLRKGRSEDEEERPPLGHTLAALENWITHSNPH